MVGRWNCAELEPAEHNLDVAPIARSEPSDEPEVDPGIFIAGGGNAAREGMFADRGTPRHAPKANAAGLPAEFVDRRPHRRRNREADDVSRDDPWLQHELRVRVPGLTPAGDLDVDLPVIEVGTIAPREEPHDGVGIDVIDGRVETEPVCPKAEAPLGDDLGTRPETLVTPDPEVQAPLPVHPNTRRRVREIVRSRTDGRITPLHAPGITAE